MPWQPAAILYPDAELVMCDKTRGLVNTDVYIGRTIPRTWVKAVIWNRIGGTNEPPVDHALMQLRVFAPTDQACADLTRQIQARLPTICDGDPVISMTVTGGPTDLGSEPSPMRQILFNTTLRGHQQSQ